jgi:hypothetical protein
MIFTARGTGAGLMLASVLVLAGCGSGSATPQQGGAASTTPVSSGTGGPTASRALSAAGVVTALTRAGLPITGVTVYTETTDPNHLLGRPNGYTSKVAFVDERVKASDAHDSTKGSVDLGGSAEVFAGTDEALARAKYIARVNNSMQILGAEYDYVSGPVLLRVSEVLTPAQAKAYASALKKVTGHSTTLVTG